MKKNKLIVMVLCIVVCLTACNKSEPILNFSTLRFINLIPDDTSGINISMSSTSFQSGLPYGTATPFRFVDSSLNLLSVAHEGGFRLDSALTVARRSIYTCFLVNAVSSMNLLIVEETEETTDPRISRFRIAQLSPDAPALDIYYKGGSKILSDVQFKDISDVINLSSPVDSVFLDVRLAGTATTVLSPRIALGKGMIHTIYLKGFYHPNIIYPANIFSADKVSYKLF